MIWNQATAVFWKKIIISPEKNIEERFQEVREAIGNNSNELVSLDLDKAESENEAIQEKN